MRKVFEIVRIKELTVVTRSGCRGDDACDETEYIDAGKLITGLDSHEECEEWIDSFFNSLYEIQSELRQYKSQTGDYQQLPTFVTGLIQEFQEKFFYIRDTRFFDIYKFEIKTRYIADYSIY